MTQRNWRQATDMTDDTTQLATGDDMTDDTTQLATGDDMTDDPDTTWVRHLCESRTQLAIIKGQFDLTLWRLDAIEKQREDDTRWRRQVWTAIMLTVITAILSVAMQLLSVRLK